MRLLGFALACCLCAGLRADDDRAEKIERLVQSGEVSYLKADYEAAQHAYEEAWRLAQETAPADPARYTVLKRLTVVHTIGGRYDDAENYLQQALTWRENQFGPTDAKAIDDLLEISNLCRRRKDFERALVVLDRVRVLHIQTAGMESIAVADDTSRKAAIMVEWEKPETAAPMFESAIALRSKLGGADNPTLLPDLDRLGQVNLALRRYDRAEDTYRHALVIRERLYGREHADLIATLDGLAYSYYGQQKYDQAEPAYQRLLGIWTSSAGKEHPMIATVLDKMAGLYADQKKWEQANRAIEQANAVRAHFMALGLTQAAGLKLMAGDMDGAKALYQRALAAMDSANPLFDDLRARVEKDMRVFEPPRKRVLKEAPKKK